jgi:ribonuclease Z
LAEKTKHSTAKQAVQIAKDANVKQLVLGHFSSRYPDESKFIDKTKTIIKNVNISQEEKNF